MANHTSKAKRIFLIDDHPVVRQGLAKAINLEEDLTVCGEAENYPEAFPMIDETEPHGAIVDLSFGERELVGLEMIGNLRKRCPHLPILVLSMHSENILAERVLQAGAQGYIMKERSMADVVEALRKILEGGYYFSEKIRRTLFRSFSQSAPGSESSPVESFSNRELQVFRLLAQGFSTSEIGERLCISPKTVSTYQSRLKNKLNLSSNSEVLRFAIRWSRSSSDKWK